MDYIVGIDFDNTIVCYDNVMHKVAIEMGLIHTHHEKSKKHIRDSIRQLPKGEIEWRKLQAIVYGTRMQGAKLINDVKKFFNLCNRYKIKAYIISHKTEYANFNGKKVNLWLPAITW